MNDWAEKRMKWMYFYYFIFLNEKHLIIDSHCIHKPDLGEQGSDL